MANNGKLQRKNEPVSNEREMDRLDIVFWEYKKLSGPTPEAVELDKLVKAVVGTGKFNEAEARSYLNRLIRYGMFSLVKPGYIKRV
jgi:hypothetical protein